MCVMIFEGCTQEPESSALPTARHVQLGAACTALEDRTVKRKVMDVFGCGGKSHCLVTLVHLRSTSWISSDKDERFNQPGRDKHERFN